MKTSTFTESIPTEARKKLSLITEAMEKMKHHRVFSMIDSIEHLRIFMEWHVFAVWDFMSLVKRLQIDFTHTSLPWLPPHNQKAARLINEIVLGEETDLTPTGDHASHFELYLSAMREIGASTKSIEQFICLLRDGNSVKDALHQIDAPAPIATFVQSTVNTACTGKTSQVLGSFFYGREDPIPQMFQSVLKSWKLDVKLAPIFVYYLERHIELDSDNHGPAAQIIISETLGNHEESWLLMLNAAQAAIEQRTMLWDALADTLNSTKSPKQKIPEYTA